MSPEPSASSDRSRVLGAERAVNEEYLIRLRDLVGSASYQANSVPRTQNEQWAGERPRPSVTDEIIGPIVGRVALDADDALLGRGFYIGSWHREWDGVQVVSWAAKVASLYYEGPRSKDALAPSVVARRTFVHSALDLRDFDDQLDGDEVAVDDVFPAAGGPLRVPRAPAVVRPARRPVEVVPDEAPEPADDETEPRASGLGAREPSATTEGPPTPTPEPPAEEDGLRAERVVREAIEMPRTGRLHSVLSTLQPDQYRLVTWPADAPLIVQGQPGTGKTIIATHRAAYLTHPEREEGPLARVALFGPTDQYADHVGTLRDELGASSPEFRSLRTFLRDLARVSGDVDETPGQRVDFQWKVGVALDRCARLLLDAGRFRGEPQRWQQILVDAFVSGDRVVRSVATSDPDIQSLRTALRSWAFARTKARFVPFLASATLAISAIPESGFYDHILVDEAQDVRPLEWRIITKLLKPGAGLSVLGDINQRHSDWSPASWHALAVDLEITDDDSGAPVHELRTGYRSTRQILRFANQLLPSEGRVVHALRDGPQPVIHRVGPTQVVARSVERVTALGAAFAPGVVAVITMEPEPIKSRMRTTGWRVGDLRMSWVRDDATVFVLDPESARGLEFDAVVVVEPARFPENLGRLGPLYTSLTRATKQLEVVHSAALPKRLKAPKS